MQYVFLQEPWCKPHHNYGEGEPRATHAEPALSESDWGVPIWRDEALSRFKIDGCVHTQQSQLEKSGSTD